MALAKLLDDPMYMGGKFLFRNKNADLEVKGSISGILPEKNGVTIVLAENSTNVRISGRLHPASGNELIWPIFESVEISVNEIRHGIEVEWKGQGLYAKVEKKL